MGTPTRMDPDLNGALNDLTNSQQTTIYDFL